MSCIIIICLVSWVIQMFFLLVFYIKISGLKKGTKERKDISGEDITIVICARNELENLRNNLHIITSQKLNQKNCNVIYINDASTDGSKKLLEEYAKKHKNLKVVSIKEEDKKEGKLNALLLGIQQVSSKFLVLTDADCTPSSENWAGNMVSLIKKNKKIVLGYAPYTKENSFVNFLVQYETTLTAIQYFGFALIGFPYMGVGRNIAYDTKFIKEKLKKYQHPKNVISGDDDLIVNKFSNYDNTCVLLNQDSICFSKAPKNINDWITQKVRHLSVGKYYKTQDKLMLSIFAISHFLLIGTIFVSIFTAYLPIFLLVLIRFWLIIKLFSTFFIKSSNFYTILTVLMGDLLHFFYYSFISVFSFIKPKINWK